MPGADSSGRSEHPARRGVGRGARCACGQGRTVPSRVRRAWGLPSLPPQSPSREDADEVVGVSREPSAQALLVGYARGLFAMPAAPGLVAWWSPQPRGVLPLDGLRVSRSLRRSLRRYEVTVDAAFPAVLAACADPRRRGAWISPHLSWQYTVLHAQGHVRSVEVWGSDGDLAGGLFGVVLGGLFAGESMFSSRADASKVALVRLVEALGGPAGAREGRLLDVQWATDHLRSLGVVDVDRRRYADLLARAAGLPEPPGLRPGRRWAGPGTTPPGTTPPGTTTPPSAGEGGRRVRRAQPLTDPAVMPRTKNRWRLKKTISGMIIVTKAPAVSR